MDKKDKAAFRKSRDWWLRREMNEARVAAKRRYKDFWLVSEAAEASGLTPSWVRELIKRGKLDGERVGGVWIITDESVRKWLESRPKKWEK